MKTAYLSLGSNVGDRRGNLERAIALLESSGMEIKRRSALYATEPVDFGPQNWFLNCVLEIETELMPRQLLRTVQEVERDMGRRRMVRRGPRIIDIDVLLYGSSVVNSSELQVPHVRMHQRRFVLLPLAEIAPAVRHPLLHATIAELLSELKDTSKVRRLPDGKAK